MPKGAEITIQYVLPVVGAIIAILLFIWRTILEPSNKIEKKIHGFLVRIFTRKIDVEMIAKRIQELKLTLSNADSLSIQSFVDTNRCVYFPVVPKPNLSVIHLVFLKNIVELQKLGLKVKIFIFDDYYRRKENIEPKAAQIQIENFVNKFTEHGVARSKLFYESKFNKHKHITKIVYNRELDLCSRFNIQEIDDIRAITAPTTDNGKPYIMQQKIIYNMAYLSVMKNIGFVLCGQDEIPLWEKFSEKENYYSTATPTTAQIVILGIPLMKNSSGQAMSMWSGNNLYSNINREIINAEINANLTSEDLIRADCGVFYLLENLHYSSNGAKIELPTSNGNIVFHTIDELMIYFKSHDRSDLSLYVKQVDILVTIIYNILHNKKIEGDKK